MKHFSMLNVQAPIEPRLVTVPSFTKVVRRAAIALVVVPLVAIPVAVMAVVSGPTLSVPVDGSIGTGADAITFSGQMTVATRIIDDPVFNGPTVLELVIDFSGVKGAKKGSAPVTYVTNAQAVIHRPLLAFDPIEATFPYYAANNALSAQTAKAALSVSFGGKTGVGITSKIGPAPVN